MLPMIEDIYKFQNFIISKNHLNTTKNNPFIFTFKLITEILVTTKLKLISMVLNHKSPLFESQKIKNSKTGNRTRVTHATGGNTNHCTISDS